MTSIFFETYLRQFNAHIGRTHGDKVLLLIDNAPNHAFEHLTLSHIEICPLPPNTTSKLQPLDAGIISSFKRHYRKRQLEHALNCIEAAQHPYKIDQLTAMRWVQAAWNEIDQSVFINCWNHSTLLANCRPRTLDSDSAAMIQPQDDELTALIASLQLQKPMAIENFLDPIEESQVHAILTDEELLAAAETQEEDEDQEEAEEVVPLAECFSREEQVKAFTVVMAALEEREKTDSEEVMLMLRRLRKTQAIIRNEIRAEKEMRAGQTLITSFFSK
jgi:DDE superfamily endonuclease